MNVIRHDKPYGVGSPSHLEWELTKKQKENQMTNKPDNNQLITPEFRVAFPAVFEAKLNTLSGKSDFSVVMLFDKQTDISALRRAAEAAARAKWGDKLPPNLRNPIRDGSEKPDLEGYEGCWFVKADSKFQPGVVDQYCVPISDQSKIYAGCYCKAYISPWAYDMTANKGVKFNLIHLQKVRDGDSLISRAKPESVFQPLEDVPGEIVDAGPQGQGIFG